jgi:hypothetical protein
MLPKLHFICVGHRLPYILGRRLVQMFGGVDGVWALFTSYINSFFWAAAHILTKVCLFLFDTSRYFQSQIYFLKTSQTQHIKQGDSDKRFRLIKSSSGFFEYLRY